MRVERYDLPLASPIETARERIERREGFVVRIEHDGVEGVGEAAPIPGFTESLAECEAALERVTVLAAHEGIEAAHDALDPTETPAAAHGLALAVVDATARLAEEPLYRFLGGDRRKAVPVNATVGDGSPTEAAEAAAAARANGCRTVKVKVGVRDPESDAARLAAVREAVGSDVALRADANGAWSRAAADRFVDAVVDRGVGIQYLEQPLAADDLAGHAALADGPVPIALDESLGRYDLDEVLAADAADAVVLKPMALGSPAATRAAGLRAVDAGLGAVVTTTIDAVVARTAAVHVAASIPGVAPSGLATASLLEADLGPDPAPVEGGAITVPQSPGLGVAEVTV